MMLETEHPVPLVVFCSIITIILFFFLMIIPVKTVLQKLLKKCNIRKSNRANKPLKQLAAPDHRRDVIGNVKSPWRAKEGSVTGELRR